MTNDILSIAKKAVKTPTSVSRQLAYIEELSTHGVSHAIGELSQSRKASDRALATEVARSMALQAAIEATKGGNYAPLGTVIRARLGSEGVKYDPLKHADTDKRNAWRFIPKFNAQGVKLWAGNVLGAMKRHEKDSDKGYQTRVKTLTVFADIIEACEYLNAWEQSQAQTKSEKIEA